MIVMSDQLKQLIENENISMKRRRLKEEMVDEESTEEIEELEENRKERNFATSQQILYSFTKTS